MIMAQTGPTLFKKKILLIIQTVQFAFSMLFIRHKIIIRKPLCNDVILKWNRVAGKGAPITVRVKYYLLTMYSSETITQITLRDFSALNNKY